MTADASIFEKTYAGYLEQIGRLPLEALAGRIGATWTDGALEIPLLDRTLRVSPGGIVDAEGRRPAFDICVILSRYVLMAPESAANHGDWVSFKDFKDAAPLANYFGNEVERAVATRFSGRLPELSRAGEALAGWPLDLDVLYDLALQFGVLPRVPVAVLFNDADEAFPAACSILFPGQTDRYLDAECIAMLGHRLLRELKRAAERGQNGG